MKRLLFVVTAAVAGSAVGMLARQLTIDRPEAGLSDIVVSAPPTNIALSAMLGLVAGADGPMMAFMAGFAVSGAVGDDMEEFFPQLEPIREKLRFPQA